MISLIVATSLNNCIGINNKLPWHIPEDLKYFRSLTSGHPIIMGRKTYESIGKALPNRHNIVLSHDPYFSLPDATVVHSIDEALALCSSNTETFIIGGAQIYKAFLPYADKLYITQVDLTINGDAYFPDYTDLFYCISSIKGSTEATPTTPNFTFTLWERKSSL